MSDPWSELLSDYVNGDLAAVEARHLESHLQTCDECREELEEIRRVVSWAASYEPSAPASDPWPAIAARIGHPDHRPWVWSGWSPLALAATLILLVAGALLLTHDRDSELKPTPSVLAGDQAADRSFHEAATYLEHLLASRSTELDAERIEFLDRTGQSLDLAIREIRRALERTPDSQLLRDLLRLSRRQRLDLFRDALDQTLTKS